MAWTKREFVVQAFEEIGFSSYVFDAAPEQLNSVLRRLDAMLARWNANGIRLGYPLPSSPSDSSLNESTNVPDACVEAVYLNLAIAIAPSFGKTVAQETKQAAKAAYDALLNKLAEPMEMQLNTSIPSGAGNKYGRFLDEYIDPLLSGNDGQIEFN